MRRLGNSKPSCAASDLSVRRLRASGAEIVPGRREDRGAGSLPTLSHRVYLGSDLLRGQPADCIPDGKAGDRRAAIRRVCLGDNELRGGTALGHPSLASENRSGFDHYRADLAHSPRRVADRAGGVEMGAEKIATRLRWLVIVNNLDVGIAVVPTKTKPPLIVDANAVLTLSVGSQGLQPVPGRALPVSQDHRTFHLP